MATKARPKAVLKGEHAEGDCFVDGVIETVKDTCEGIRGSNRCAACRLKKNYLQKTFK